MAKKRKNRLVGDRKFWETLAENEEVYNHYYNMMVNIWLALYQWEGLPESMDARYIERTLLYNPGIAVFWEDVFGGLVNLPFNQLGKPDIYGNPTSIEVYSSNNYHNTLWKKDDYRIIWGNYNRIPPYNSIKMFAYRMYETVRTADVNISGQKNPKILLVPEGQNLSFENLMMKIEGNQKYIPVKEYIDLRTIDTLDLTVPYVADKLDVHAHLVFNEFLTFCGIENSNMDKKERLVADEVNGNYGNVEVSRNTGLLTRQEAANQINKKYGTDIRVSFESNLRTLLNYDETGEVI